VSDDRLQTLRRQMAELSSVVRRLDQSGLDSARAQLLLSRKRAELDDFINRGVSDASTAQMVRSQQQR
jgi:hypothetical protein